MRGREDNALQRVAIDELRDLCAWYEWSEPPDVKVASVLQAAADAVGVGTLSIEAADALIAVWKPFIGLEAQVGNEPPTFAIAGTEEDLQRAVVIEMRRMIAREGIPAKRVHLTQLMDRQIQDFVKGAP